MTKTYSSKSNANRAIKTLAAKLDDTFTVGEPQQTADGTWFFEIVSHRPEVTLAPETLEVLAPFVVTYPAPPQPSDSPVKRANMKPFAQWDLSTCETPVAVAWEIFGAYHEACRIDERKAAIKDAMDAGVQRNTAHTQYRRFRIKHGLPGAVGKTEK